MRINFTRSILVRAAMPLFLATFVAGQVRAEQVPMPAPSRQSGTETIVGTRRAGDPVQTITYAPGTMRVYERALRRYLKGDLETAERLAHDTLQYEPNSIEARWLLANIYRQRQEVGRMLMEFAELGVREAFESELRQRIVYEGSRGYVLAADPDFVTIDLTARDGVSPGDQFVVYEEGRVLTHPITLEIVNVEKRIVAEVEVFRVFSNYSTARIEKLLVDVEDGMRVLPKGEFDTFLEPF